MVKKLKLLILALSTGLVASAQQSNVDFESVLHDFQEFGGTSFMFDTDPLDSLNSVGSIANSGAVWEGIYLDLPNPVSLDNQKTISIKYYNFTSMPQTVLLKLEGSNNPDVEVDVTTSVNGWTTLIFDFSQARISGTPTPINASGTYKKLVLFINGSSSQSGSYLIDDITYPNYESANSLDVVYTNLVYAEEFTSFGPVDTSNWFQEVVPPNAWGWFNGEQQHYTNRTDNSYVSNGSLKIVAKKETFNAYGLTLDYTSARLNSKFNFTYGRIDVRAKLPQGDGTWPAIWMLGTSIGNNWHPTTIGWPGCGEIDIMEHWGNNPNTIHGSTHTISSNGATVNTSQVRREGVFDDWHVYSVNWSPNQISFLVDGFLYYTYNPSIKDATTWPFDAPQFVILNVAMGGIYSIDPNFVESEMEVDYVRVYQNNISVKESSLQAEVEIFPNPTSRYIYLKVDEPGTFKIYDVLGQVILMEEIEHTGQVELTLPELSSGIYIWNFEVGEKSASGRLQIINE